jgi:hypothetical protein
MIAVASAAEAEPPQDQSYLSELLLQAAQTRLWNDRYWHLLLHYHQNIGEGYTSQADGAAFFLAPRGKTDPRAELEATIRKLFTDEPVGLTRQPTQCGVCGALPLAQVGPLD